MARIVFIVLLLLFTGAHAQNLVPNPSFEDTVCCPHNIIPSDLYCAAPWFPATLSPDFMHSCDTNKLDVPNNSWGTQFARTGEGYAGFYTLNLIDPNKSRDYIEVKLKDTLSAGVKYHVQFYVSLADEFHYATNTIGAYFSPVEVFNSTAGYFNYTPQILNSSTNALTDKNNWIAVSDSFTAVGNEVYLLIGNFNLDGQSDTTFVGGSGWGNKYAYYYIDDVSVLAEGTVGIKDNDQKKNIVKLYPNPANTFLNIETDLKENETGTITFYNSIGAVVFKEILNSTFNTVSLEALNPGIYMYQVQLQGKPVKSGKLSVIK